MMQVHCQARSRRASVELGGALTLFTSHLQQKLERQAILTSIHIMAFAWKAAGLSYASLVAGGIR